jgi:hypothetical protein
MELMHWVILGNALVILWVVRDTIVSVRKIAEAVQRVEETASRTERITAKMLTMIGEIEEREQ